MNKLLSHTKIVVIAGPTASGKSKLAMDIAKSINGVIINADSMQLYQDLPILTARPSLDDQFQVPHALYGILGPFSKSSLGWWYTNACNQIQKAYRDEKIPIVVGGTGMYLNALFQGISTIPEIPFEMRDQIRSLALNLSQEELIQKVQSIDPLFPKKMTDRQRLTRAWEVIKHTGKSITLWQKANEKLETFRIFSISLCPQKEQLRINIDKRLDLMQHGGVLEEVDAFLKVENYDKSPLSKAVGFKEFKQHLQGDISLETAHALALNATWQYAKRQITWFKGQMQFTLSLSNEGLNLSRLLEDVKGFLLSV